MKWIINFNYTIDNYAISHEKGEEWTLPTMGWKFWSGNENVDDKTLKITGENCFDKCFY